MRHLHTLDPEQLAELLDNTAETYEEKETAEASGMPTLTDILDAVNPFFSPKNFLY